jgi:hypothetical protein
MRTSYETAARASTHYAFDSLHALPCGCVAAVYRTYPSEVEVVALEARGPHCLYQQHEIGTVLGLDMGDSDRLSR